MAKVKGEVGSIIFKSDDNSFSVIRVDTANDKITIVGCMPSLVIGESITVTGKWISHPQHGKQLEAETVSISDPNTLDAVEKYISSLIKGIGPKYAKKIVNLFKDETWDILNKTPSRLSEVEGIGKKRLKQIQEEWKNKQEHQKNYHEIMIFCASKQITPSYANKIFHQYGQKSIKILQENPYQLAIDIKGIGFQMADKFAMQLKIPKDSDIRIKAGIEYMLHMASQFGHTCLPYDLLLRKSKELLGLEEDTTEKILKKELKEQNLIIQNDKVSTPFFFNIEIEIKNEINRLLSHPKQHFSIRILKENLHFTKQQIGAIHKTLKSKIHILTGGPGTGKTTITSALIELLDTNKKKYLLCAPTGKASQKLGSATKRYTKTIHGLLELNPGTFRFKRTSENPLDCDFVIVDESSMIDSRLFLALLQAIPNNSHLVLIGDVDQIPSIGAGNILHDLIEAKIATTRLTEIFRQKKLSLIIKNAHLINKGEFPILKKTKDFAFYEHEESEKIKNHILDLMVNTLPQNYQFDPLKDIQLLAPIKKGPLGINMFNSFLQERINPIKQQVVAFGSIFKLNDKVIQTQNNYTKKIFNGNIGTIATIDPLNKSLKIDYGIRVIEYLFSELDQISLAYAISIHKYQGSESPCIIVPLHTSYFKMLQRKLVYTAVTRAKKLIILLGQKKAIAMAINNTENTHRYTQLKEIMTNTFSNLLV